MSGRASIKGQGASIFFGEEATPTPPHAVLPAPAAEQVRADPDTEASRRHGADEPSNQPAAAPTSEHSDEGAFFASLVLPLELRRKLRSMSRGEHPFHTSVRLSREEMDALRDLCYELESRMGIVANRNDVTRIALRLLLEDYALRKKESLLVQVLKED